MAFDKQYGFDYLSSGPVYKSHQTNGNYLTVDFSSKGSGLEFKNDNYGFEIAGEDNEFYDANAKIINNKLRLYNKCNKPYKCQVWVEKLDCWNSSK